LIKAILACVAWRKWRLSRTSQSDARCARVSRGAGMALDAVVAWGITVARA